MKLIYNDNTKFNFTSSGKSSIKVIFDYLIDKKNINPKYDEAFVPKYMGTWVYSQLNHVICSNPVLTDNTKIIYLYHQFGIPQKIDEIFNQIDSKKFIIIEDSAHTLGGRYKNYDLGTVGDYTLFSFSKFFNFSMLGGLHSVDVNFIKESKIKINKSKNSIYYLLNILHFINFFCKKDSFSEEIVMSLAYSLYNFSFKPRQHFIYLLKKKIKNEINLRIDRLKLVRNELRSYDLLNYDTSEDLYAAWAIPIIFNSNEKTHEISSKLKDYNLEMKAMNFDVNRNLLKTNYKKSLLIDISAKESILERQLSIIKKNI
ncbi:DegT/DnrJ/EryC1/StrS family aminotransferase [Candidatus Pelagibacter sp.]|nr:DegT/DnrJ/EryC1/StrS family aminotransferase [Candidatus Pelagibacter sp.]